MKRYSEEEKKMWLDDWKASGLSAWKYARANALNYKTLENWAASGTQNEKLVEVTGQLKSETVLNEQEILIEKGGVKIRVTASSFTACLKPLMELLGAVL